MGTRKHFINLIFTLTLLGVFAISAILVAVMGSQVYKHSADKMQANFDTRTSLVYMSEKIRQCPQGGIKVSSVAGSDALVLSEDYGGETFESWIYVHEGQLYEAVVPANTQITPRDGQRIMDLKSLEINDTGGLIKLTVVNSKNHTDSLSLSRRL